MISLVAEQLNRLAPGWAIVTLLFLTTVLAWMFIMATQILSNVIAVALRGYPPPTPFPVLESEDEDLEHAHWEVWLHHPGTRRERLAVTMDAENAPDIAMELLENNPDTVVEVCANGVTRYVASCHHVYAVRLVR